MMLSTFNHGAGVVLSDAAYEVGLALLRKGHADAHPWHVEPRSERFILRHAKTDEVLRGAGGRLSVFGSAEAAQRMADKLNGQKGITHG